MTKKSTRWRRSGFHTSGPWRARQIRYGSWSIETELPCINGLSAWFTIATVHAVDDAERLMSDGVRADANDDARLIAAAPDYAAAVEQMLAHEESGGDGWWRGWEMLRAAHGKAGGHQ